jgi:hypothetical protein
MGTYTHLEVAGYPLWTTKSKVDPKAMSIFRESDRVVRRRFVSERNSLIWSEGEIAKDETETAILYSCSVTQALDRLSIMGITLERVRREFESIRHKEIEKYDEWGAESDDGAWGEEVDFLSQLDFEAYSDALRRVITNGLQPLPFDDRDDPNHDSVVKYILSDSEEYWLGFLCSDIRSLIRIACELVDPQASVVQDVTDLVEGGYYSRDQKICSEAVLSLSQDHPESASRIILTEGSTDREFLEKSLHLLYPHLIGYYSFLDFDGMRPQGGAGSLALMVKAFAAAGFSDRIIAIFDNDAAAADAIRTLDRLSLPKNIAVLTYPPIDLLRQYPTIGPSGQADIDVNGSAASIELYLGRDVLLEKGTLIPVQWKGYINAIDRYQGEVRKKNDIHAAFRQKLERSRRDANAFDQADWSGLRVILESIFAAFD